MFYYYGAKNQAAKHYPPPESAIIIEPFAGSAGYAQFHRKTHWNTILFEADERIVGLWHRLLGMTAEEILAIPTPVVGEYYDDPFMDQLIKQAAASNGTSNMTKPLKTPKRVVEGSKPGASGTWDMMLRRMAERVDDLRGWTVIHGDYKDSLIYVKERFPVGSRFTWFIDPPYEPQATDRNKKTQFRHGDGYRQRFKAVDYEELRKWVELLPGQVICCEKEGATWMRELRPRSLIDMRDSQGRVSKEVISTWNTTLAPVSGEIISHNFPVIYLE